MADLFTDGEFLSHSGRVLPFKIDADALTDKDLATLAKVVGSRFSFHSVYGVPRGGIRFAEALVPYCHPAGKVLLIVDDVLTTGRSMEEARQQRAEPCDGIVIFARGHCPPWISALFTFNDA